MVVCDKFGFDSADHRAGSGLEIFFLVVHIFSTKILFDQTKFSLILTYSLNSSFTRRPIILMISPSSNVLLKEISVSNRPAVSSQLTFKYRFQITIFGPYTHFFLLLVISIFYAYLAYWPRNRGSRGTII